MKHEARIHPIYLGSELRKVIIRKTYQDVEGSCHGNTGYIIAITSITNIESGLIVEGGFTLFKVDYNAIVFRPMKNEVMDGIVKNVNKLGLFVLCGPMMCFVSHSSLPIGMKYDPEQVPECYRSFDESITTDDNVRVRLIGIRVDSDKIFGIGTMADDFLGLLQ